MIMKIYWRVETGVPYVKNIHELSLLRFKVQLSLTKFPLDSLCEVGFSSRKKPIELVAVSVSNQIKKKGKT